mgnify:CR=1 FL=1
MNALAPIAAAAAALLVQSRQTVAVSESSAGGLISAALLAIPGASAYFQGGGVIYTQNARRALLGIGDDRVKGIRSSTEAYALLGARAVREKLATTWGLAETGASGPTGNRYGDAAGHACIAVAGPVRARDHHRDGERGPGGQYVGVHARRPRSPPVVPRGVGEASAIAAHEAAVYRVFEPPRPAALGGEAPLHRDGAPVSQVQQGQEITLGTIRAQGRPAAWALRLWASTGPWRTA